MPIIALGINDSFGTAPATIVTNATAVLDNLAAGGAQGLVICTPDTRLGHRRPHHPAQTRRDRVPGAAQSPMLFQFVNDIDNDQRAEIRRMQTLLAAWSK